MENKLVLWDIDGTLMYCGSNGTLALNETILELYGVEDAFMRSGVGQMMDSVILEKILSKCRIKGADKNEIVAVYVSKLEQILRANPEKCVLPGVVRILDHIENHPFLFSGLLTSNFKQGAQTKLMAVELLNYFKVGGYGDVPGEKWDAALKGLEEAQQYYGVSFRPENVFIIGDTAYDITCARLLKMKSIGVATGWTDYGILAALEPDYLFKDLSDFDRVIQLLEE